ncbi:MAG: c-type cytochrome biogenesis protein CcsB, partial [Betaproteobacteria bacterium]
LHVPANFIGYGTFSLAAMVSLAYLLKTASPRALWTGLVGMPLLVGVLPVGALLLLSQPAPDVAAAYTKSLTMLAGLITVTALTTLARNPINARTPAAVVMDDLMYKAIAVGFAFFTIATILGAFWAAEAWGGYLS